MEGLRDEIYPASSTAERPARCSPGTHRTTRISTDQRYSGSSASGISVACHTAHIGNAVHD
eukprot:590052-Rhodomonas_salina.1